MQIKRKKRSSHRYHDKAKHKEKAVETKELYNAYRLRFIDGLFLLYLLSWFEIGFKGEDAFCFPAWIEAGRGCRRQYLYSGLRELCPLRQLLPGINIRVVGSLKSAFQFFKLFCCEGGSAPALFPL